MFEGDTEAEDEEVAGEGEVADQGEVKGEVPSIKIEQAEEDGSDDDDEEEEDVEEAQEETISAETSKRVRFAEAQRLPPLKVETKDVEVWTQEPEYEHYMCVRMYAPVGMKQMDLKCSVAFGKHFYKSKRLDENTGTPLPANTPTSQIKKNRYEEAMFSIPQETLPGIWQGKKPVGQELPKNCQITVHSGPTDSIAAMATIDMADLKELDLKTITLPPPHGDDEVPRTPEPPGDDDLDSLSDDMEIPLPGDERKGSEKPGATEDRIKDVDPMMFPLYSLDGSSTKHSPCGSLPLIFYWARRPKPPTFNRQIGTHGVTELVFELTGIDLETTSKDDLNKETHDKCTSVMSYRREVTDRALSAHRFTPEVEPSNPPASPEHEYIPEVIVTENMELEKKEEPKEELIAKAEYDKVVEKHNNDLVYLQEEYEKRLQVLMDNLQLMEKNQRQHQQQMMKQQQQLEEQQKLLSQRNITSPGLSPQATFAPPGTPTKKSDEVHRPVVHAPMPPQKARPRQQKKRPAVVQRTWDGVPSEFLERLAYFEDESYRHKLELIEKTRREIQEDIEKKLAGQHKLSRHDREMYEALNDVSLPALFMPFQRGSVFNPRAHQYFHPTGSTDIRLTQPPSMFQLPPLHKNSSSILNLFELSKNFNSRGQGWLMDRYIQQQEPLKNPHGMMPQTTMPTSMMRSPTFTPQPTFDLPSTRDEQRQREAEAEC
ncbi:hypothetical protein DPMN_042710 [Dreissena polymorpha]|uniref:Uncharacterized protein n=1 Tax=Dreissena polymorpha TaxID=45954 RepID=A0A9D4HX98_DREPO|nr:hypothetical protein DPMN_042710 [Dreissena polymorpha]